MTFLKLIFAIPLFIIKTILMLVRLLVMFNGVAYFLPGSGRTHTDQMRADLEANDYPVLDSTYPTFGGGGYQNLSRRMIVGGEGGGGGDVLYAGKYAFATGSGHGHGFIGLMLRPLPFLRVYPLIGTGGGGGGTMLLEPQGDDIVLPPPSSEIRQSHNVFDPLIFLIGVGIELRLGIIVLGGRIGYLQSPFADGSVPEKRLYMRPIIGIARSGS